MTLTETETRRPEPDADEPTAERPPEDEARDEEPRRCSCEGGVVRLGS